MFRNWILTINNPENPEETLRDIAKGPHVKYVCG